MSSTRDQIFLCYSHADAEWLDRLRKHLKPLERQGRFPVWHDREIRPGAKWRDEIQSALRLARVAVLLVSPDFLASDYIAETELPEILRAAKHEGVRILWIPVRPSGVEWTELEGIQCVGNPKKPLSAMTESEVDAALVEVVREVERAWPAAKKEPHSGVRLRPAIVIGLLLAVATMGAAISMLLRSQGAHPQPVPTMEMSPKTPLTLPEPIKTAAPPAPAAPVINIGSPSVNISGTPKVGSIHQEVHFGDLPQPKDMGR